MSEPVRDIAAERREARIRRILGNSQNRLKKITSLTGSDTSSEDALRANHVDTIHIPTSQITETASSESDIFRAYDETPEISEPAWKPPEPVVTNDASVGQHDPKQIILSSHLFHIASLAIFTFVLFRFELGHLTYFNALLPFLTLEMAHVIYGKQQPPSGMASLLHMALKMYNLSTVATAITYTSSFIQNLFFYVFFLVLSVKIFGIEYAIT